MRKHVIAITYALFAGLIASLVTYYLLFRTLGLLENSSISQIVGLLTISSPVIGPLMGAFLFLKFMKNIPPDLWKYAIIYSLIIAITHEIYLFYFEPLWSWSGLIIGVVSGIVISFVAYKKSKMTTESP